LSSTSKAQTFSVWEVMRTTVRGAQHCCAHYY